MPIVSKNLLYHKQRNDMDRYYPITKPTRPTKFIPPKYTYEGKTSIKSKNTSESLAMNRILQTKMSSDVEYYNCRVHHNKRLNQSLIKMFKEDGINQKFYSYDYKNIVLFVKMKNRLSNSEKHQQIKIMDEKIKEAFRNHQDADSDLNWDYFKSLTGENGFFNNDLYPNVKQWHYPKIKIKFITNPMVQIFVDWFGNN